MLLFYLLYCFMFTSCFSAEFTLVGECPNIKYQENLDYTKTIFKSYFNNLQIRNNFDLIYYGIIEQTTRKNHQTEYVKEAFLIANSKWFNIANYASDGRRSGDCSKLDFLEDNIGFTLNESFIDTREQIRIKKTYFARVDPTFDAGNKAKLIISYEDGDKVLQFPYYLLWTDYDNYAIAYTCKTLKKKARMHYVYTWILSRTDKKLEGEYVMKIRSILSKYPELSEKWSSFVLKDFSDESCKFDEEYKTNFFTDNFW